MYTYYHTLPTRNQTNSRKYSRYIYTDVHIYVYLYHVDILDICTHIFIHTCMYTYMYIYIMQMELMYAHIFSYIHVYIFIHTRIPKTQSIEFTKHTYRCTRINQYTYSYAHIYSHVHVCTHTYISSLCQCNRYLHTYFHTYMYIFIHIFTHTRISNTQSIEITKHTHECTLINPYTYSYH